MGLHKKYKWRNIKLKAENINIFYDTLKNTFQEVLGAGVERGDLDKSSEEDLVDKTNLYVKIEGDLEGHFYLSLPEETALTIVEKMAGMAPDEIDSFARSAISELGNMIAGRISSKFYSQGEEISSSPPEVIADAGAEEVDLFGEAFILIPVASDIGKLQMHISLS